MSESFNIRIEKQEQSKIRVVDIQKFQVDKLRKRFNQYLEKSDGMILITIKGRKRFGYSTFTDNDTVFYLEKIKSKFLED